MVTKKDLYSKPKYYDLAFCSFRNVKFEVDVIEECIRRYSRTPVKKVLELACGTSPNLKELIQRGYEYTGFDITKSIISYTRKKYKLFKANATFIVKDTLDFVLDNPVDFIFIMGGALCVKKTQDILLHFESVANSLKIGGLYLLDSCVEFNIDNPQNDKWTIKKSNVAHNAEIATKFIDKVNQLLECRLILDVNEKKRNFHLESKDFIRIIFPQEFLLLIEKSKRFEFIGWWNNWNLNEPIEKATKIIRPLILIRRI